MTRSLTGALTPIFGMISRRPVGVAEPSPLPQAAVVKVPAAEVNHWPLTSVLTRQWVTLFACRPPTAAALAFGSNGPLLTNCPAGRCCTS